MLGIELYRRTVISPFILTLVIVVGAAAGFWLFWKRFLLVAPNQFWAAVNCCATGGGFFYYAFLMLNHSFASSDRIKAEFNIVDFGTLARGSKSSCSQPYFVINFAGKEKELVFKCNLEFPLEDYSKVSIVYQKGLFGFEYILEKYPKIR